MILKFRNNDGYFEYEVMSAFAGTNDFILVLKKGEDLYAFGLLQSNLYQFGIYPIKDNFDKIEMINMSIGEIYDKSYIKVDLSDFVKENVIWPTYFESKPISTLGQK